MEKKTHTGADNHMEEGWRDEIKKMHVGNESRVFSGSWRERKKDVEDR